MDVWRVYGAAESVCRSLDGLAAEAAAAASRAEGTKAALSSANEVLAASTLLACVALARMFSWPLADGTLIAFAVPFFMAYRPLRDLGDARTAIDRGAAALALLEDVACARPARSASVRASTVVPLTPRTWESAVLEVRGLGVVRPGADAAEDSPRTSFVLRPGEIVAIVGPTGSGKTTLLRALLGLETGVVGSIRYGAASLALAGVGPSQRPFAWAPQEAPLLAGTLEENVLLGRVDPGAVEEALRLVGAAKLARACAGAELGASGRAVSGGERKWIALARAIASNQPVLLLDEPTAGLDGASQEHLLGALQCLRATRAIVVVTHHRDASRWADRVVAIGRDGEDQNWASSRGSFSNIKRTSGMS
jgi:ABC-type transport system involved in cytochrome bd biosynthesis fused ATPase/permease subunit